MFLAVVCIVLALAGIAVVVLGYVYGDKKIGVWKIVVGGASFALLSIGSVLMVRACKEKKNIIVVKARERKKAPPQKDIGALDQKGEDLDKDIKKATDKIGPLDDQKKIDDEKKASLDKESDETDRKLSDIGKTIPDNDHPSDIVVAEIGKRGKKQ